jgi:tripartite-type tricarboxylate transporter receptor subunit TctC
MRELGLGELETSGWAGLYAPAGTPEPAIRKLNSAVNDILALPDVAKRLSELGMRPAGGTPQAVDALARQQLEQWRDTVAQSGFVID